MKVKHIYKTKGGFRQLTLQTLSLIVGLLQVIYTVPLLKQDVNVTEVEISIISAITLLDRCLLYSIWLFNKHTALNGYSLLVFMVLLLPNI